MKKKTISGLIVLIAINLTACGFGIPGVVNSEEARAMRIEGIEYAAQGKFQEAQEQFRKALEINKSDNTSASSLGTLEDLRNGKISADFAVCLFKGLNCLQNQDTQAALSLLQKAQETTPDYPKIYNIIGAVYAARGETQNAVVNFKKAIQLDPGYAQAYFNLASLYNAQGDFQEAIANYEEAIKNDPDGREAANDLGNLYASEGEYQKAISCLERAVKSDPHNAGAYYQMGMSYFMSDKIIKSKECFLKAKELYLSDQDEKGAREADKYLNKFKALEEKYHSAQ